MREVIHLSSEKNNDPAASQRDAPARVRTWEAMLDRAERAIGERGARVLRRNVEIAEMNRREVVLLVREEHATYIRDRFGTYLRTLAEQVTGVSRELRIVPSTKKPDVTIGDRPSLPPGRRS